MLRRVLLAMSRRDYVRAGVQSAPYTREIVRRFVAGESLDDALRVIKELTGRGLLVTLDHLGEDTHSAAQAGSITDAYVDLLERLPDLGRRAEVSVKLTAVGQALPGGEDLALRNARRICAAAKAAGTTVTLDTEDHTTVDSTLRVLRTLRGEFPETGAVVQSYLRRAEDICLDLAYEGSRVRLCKGAYDAPEAVAFQRRSEIDKSFVRCMRILMAGKGYPMLATHDPRLIEIGEALAVLNEREPDGYEHQMLYGMRPGEQQRLATLGHRVRVYVPYGDQWYGYFMRRLAERPANLGFFLRSMTTRAGR